MRITGKEAKPRYSTVLCTTDAPLVLCHSFHSSLLFQSSVDSSYNLRCRVRLYSLPFLLQISNQERNVIRKVKKEKDKKGRAIPQKRQASLSPTPRISGSNPPTPLCFMTPGKQTVPSGTGIPKMIGKKPTQIIRTGRRLRTGSNQQSGLRHSYLEALLVNREKTL